MNPKLLKTYILLPNKYTPEEEFQNYVNLMSIIQREFIQDSFLEEIERTQSIVRTLDGNPIDVFFSKDKINELDKFVKFRTQSNKRVDFNELSAIVNYKGFIGD